MQLGSKQWLGRADCVLPDDHPKRQEGYRGALMTFACLASDIGSCVKLLQNECLENNLVVVGFEYLFNRDYMDRDSSEYEEELILKLVYYPVQFHNVHFYKLDS